MATRTVAYDAAAPGTLDTLLFDQTSNFVNTLEVNRNLNVTNGITLAAATGTERLYVLPVTSNVVLTVPGGIAVESGGRLVLGSRNPSGGTSTVLGDLTGNVTIAGGTLESATRVVQGTADGGSVTNKITGTLTMTSGSLLIDNATDGKVTDQRLEVTGNVNITGGSIAQTRTSGQLYMGGETNVLQPTTFQTSIRAGLVRDGDQSLTTSVALGLIPVRGYGVKTITSSHATGEIGQLQLFDGSNTANGTTARLGSNLTGTAFPAAAGFGQIHQSGRIDIGIDTVGHTLDLSGVSGIWTPNASGSSGVTNTVWTLAGDGGSIKAQAFNLSTGNTETSVSAGLTLEATGGNSTASTLSGTGSFDGTFRYAGTAVLANPATLTSTRPIGGLAVTGGVLQVSSLDNAATVPVSVSGGTLLVANAIVDAAVANLAAGTYTAGGRFGFDTAAGNRDYALAIAGQVGIVKAGSNTLTLSGSNTFTGDILIDAGTLALARADGDTYAGTISGSGGLAKIGTGGFTLSAANSYAGATSIAAGTLTLAGGNNRLPTGTTLAFTGTGGRLDVGATSQSLAGLTTPNNLTASLAVAGLGGSLAVSGSNVEIGPGGTVASGNAVTLDLSGLSSFSFTNTSSGVFRVGLKSGAGGNVASLGQVATATLAGTNTITASLIAIGDQVADNTGGSSTLRLGQSNDLNTATLRLGSNRANARLEFAAGLTNPAVKLRGTNGSSALGTMVVGNVRTFGSSWTSVVDFSGGTVDGLVTSLTVGSASIEDSTGRSGTQTSTFTMGGGTLTVGTLTVGLIASTASGTASNTLAANGTLTIGTAGSLVSAEAVNLATNTFLGGGAGAKNVSGTISLSAGTLAATSIGRGPQTGAGVTATTAFNWTGGTIANRGGTDLTIDTLPISLTSGTGTFSAEAGRSITVAAGAPISGGGAVAKTGLGRLILAGSHTYAGPTSITAGTLELAADGTLATSRFEVGAAGTLDVSALAGGLPVGSRQLGGAGSIIGSVVFESLSGLDFSSTLTVSGGTVSFAGFGIANVLGLDGTVVSAGTYTLMSGSATFDLSQALNVGFANRAEIGGDKTAYFQAGSFQVVVVPEPDPGALAAVAAGLAAAVALHRRRRP